MEYFWDYGYIVISLKKNLKIVLLGCRQTTICSETDYSPDCRQTTVRIVDSYSSDCRHSIVWTVDRA